MHVVLEITSACNLRCSHCYRSAEREGEYMDIEKIKPVLEQLFKNGCLAVEITGGEPMLYPQFFDLLEFLNQNPSVKTVAILTNGTLLNKVDMLQECLQSKKFFVSTTIDSSSPGLHDEIRKVPGSWKKTVEFLREISKDTSVRVAMNVFPENVNDIEKTLILAKENGAFSFTASPIMPTGREAGVDLKKYVRAIREYWKEMKHIFRDWKGFVAAVPPKIVEAVALGQNCGAGHRSWTISPNGNVRPCIMMADGLMNIGNVYEESLENICANKLLFSLFETQSPGSMAECRSCDYNTFCPFCIYKAICAGCDTEKKKKRSYAQFLAN
jgi:Predicted Fe-S oxidoreductases